MGPQSVRVFMGMLESCSVTAATFTGTPRSVFTVNATGLQTVQVLRFLIYQKRRPIIYSDLKLTVSVLRFSTYEPWMLNK
jgi:hypothetical protein